MKNELRETNTLKYHNKIEVEKIINNDDFPCIFGKKASKNSTILRYPLMARPKYHKIKIE